MLPNFIGKLLNCTICNRNKLFVSRFFTHNLKLNSTQDLDVPHTVIDGNSDNWLVAEAREARVAYQVLYLILLFVAKNRTCSTHVTLNEPRG